MCLFGQVRQMPEPPVAGSNQPCVRDQGLFHVRRALRNPDCEYEWLSGPVLPHLPEIVGVRITVSTAGPQQQRRVTNHESRIGGVLVCLDHVADFGVAGNEARLRAPYALEQQLQQCDAGHRASADDDAAPAELTCWSLGEEHYAADRTVARDGQIWQQ